MSKLEEFSLLDRCSQQIIELSCRLKKSRPKQKVGRNFNHSAKIKIERKDLKILVGNQIVGLKFSRLEAKIFLFVLHALSISTSNFYLSLVVPKYFQKLRLKCCLAGAFLEQLLGC